MEILRLLSSLFSGRLTKVCVLPLSRAILVMEYDEGSWKQVGGEASGFRFISRRKQVNSPRVKAKSPRHRLARALSVPEVIANGVGATIGAGVYVLVGTVAREEAGPALSISFLIAGIASALSAFCYAELASRCPSAGSAYHYSYVCVGEGVAWLVGWALILEYSIGSSAVARGISPNLALYFGGPDSLPYFLARVTIPGINVVVDPCAAVLVLIVTALLCSGIKESSIVQAVITGANICVLLFVISVGSFIGFQTGWVGYKITDGFFPYGLNGVLAGSGTVFFSYIGFDAVASTAEEVKNPQRDLPLGIGISLSICCLLYMLVSVVVVGLVPYFAMDPDTPISSAFANYGIGWAAHVITSGALLALCSAVMGSILPQPRILMAMARDGLLPSFFSSVHKRTQVPVNSTLVTGIFAASLAFFMDVSQLAGMVSVGTLFSFTIVAISILVVRYLPPDEIPLPASLMESIDSVSLRYSIQQKSEKKQRSVENSGSNKIQHDGLSQDTTNASIAQPLILKKTNQENLSEQTRRKRASWSITAVCVGVLILTKSATYTLLPFFLHVLGCSLGAFILLGGLAVLYWINQDDGRHSFGHSGGFTCPFVPALPVGSILINVYLLVNLGPGTWFRVSIWIVAGVLVYLLYGRTHSGLTNVVYVPAAHVDEIYEASSHLVV
ncbi:cationic amino acid transporter 3, mitochondrial-like isoform X1 [Zingiber officinale]|nr:cationic amino acid transporter 3, mitochondrial-like isoform X1 [Zingiber officinale]